MGTKPNTYELAHIDYMAGLKYKDIAEKYNVSINTVKSWKTRYGWDRKNKKGVHTKEKVCIQKKVASESSRQIVENKSLADKQMLFCCHYIRCFNATKAYMKAYDVDYNVAAAAGCRLLKKKEIQEMIKELKQNRLNREMLSEEDIFQKYMDIAFADITDYLEFGQEERPVMTIYGPVKIEDEKTGEKKTLTEVVNVVRFKESTNVDGTIISEVNKKNASIKIADRMKALQWLSDHMDMATEEQRKRIEKLDVDINRATGHKNDNELAKVDELIAQIRLEAGGTNDTQS